MRAAEPERPEVQRQRATFPATVQLLAPEECIFSDEAGGQQARSRFYARAPRGARALATKPVKRGRPLTMLGALRLQGLVAAMTVEGCTDGEVFRAFLRDVLVPQRRPGQVLIMDNLKAHKVADVADIGATAGVRLLDLPPYSPALSPIEACWSKVKTRLRAQAARTLAAWEQAIAEALAAVTSQDAHGWFAHAGYCIASNGIPLSV